jgi:fluoride ion exporter CrcB/FEX
MPSPLAHPAAAIPFTKAKLIFSALVIGSIAPDFGYFAPLPSSFFMYTPAGLFLFDLPVALILLWLFHTFIKWPLLSLLPVGLQRRLYEHAKGFSFGPPKRFGLILLSLLVGSLTHIVWDSFTHDYGWMVEHMAFFKTPVAGMPLYSLLQNLSTIIGIAILVYWFIRWLPNASRSERTAPHFSSGVQGIFAGLTTLSLVVVEGLILYNRFINRSPYPGRHFIGRSSVFFSAFFILGFFLGIYCLVWTIVYHKATRREA